MIRAIARNLINRHPQLFTLRQHIDTLPALLAGKQEAARRSWSQHGEDEYLVQALAAHLQDGYYVDVGANHPVRLSNTYRLYCSGMRGICIEPNPLMAKLFHRYRPDDITLDVAIGSRDGLLRYYEMSYHAYNTFSEESYRESIAAGMALVRESLRPAFRLASILRDCAPAGRQLVLLSVDTEGYDPIVLESNDWERFRPLLVIVEANTSQAASDTNAILTRVGYHVEREIAVNRMYRRNEEEV